MITSTVLVILSGLNYITLKDGARHQTGYYLSEMALPVKALQAKGYKILVATPGGSIPAMDPVSDDPNQFESRAEYEAAKKIAETLPGLRKPRSLSSFSESELQQIKAVFVPGGHAPMEDLAKDKETARILAHFHKNHKTTALICHGPAALLSTALFGRPWIYSGYQMTGFSTAEEKTVETPQVLGGYVKFYLEDNLRSLGGKTSVAGLWKSHVVVDRELITGQNPMSEKEFTKALIYKLSLQ